MRHSLATGARTLALDRQRGAAAELATGDGLTGVPVGRGKTRFGLKLVCAAPRREQRRAPRRRGAGLPASCDSDLMSARDDAAHDQRRSRDSAGVDRISSHLPAVAHVEPQRGRPGALVPEGGPVALNACDHRLLVDRFGVSERGLIAF